MKYPIEEWASLYLEGFNLTEIGELYGVSFATVGRFIKIHFGVKSVKEFYDQYYKDELMILYDDYNISVRRLSKLYKIEERQISRILKSNGVKIRAYSPPQVYKHDEEYFETIDSHDKAYWLGFLYADGCLYYANGINPVLSIELQEGDHFHLNKLKYYLRSDHPISSYSKGLVALRVYSMKLCKDLESHGMIQRKSKKVRFPFNSMHRKYYRSFVRGVFDGDGCININKNGAAFFSISSGSEKFLEEIRGVIESELGFKRSIIHKNKTCYALAYGGNVQVVKLRDWLYQDRSIFLTRKRVEFDKVKVEYVDWIVLNCPVCPKVFERKKSETHLNPRKKSQTNVTCCSKECQYEFRRVYTNATEEERKMYSKNNVLSRYKMTIKGKYIFN